MKNKKLIIVAVVGVVILAIAVPFILKAVSGPKQSTQEKVLYWTCGMHPQVKEAKPGKCPICSMPLIPVYAQQEEALTTGGAATEGSPERLVVSRVEPSRRTAAQEKDAYYGCGVTEEGHCPHCDLGQADAVCICGGHSFLEKGEIVKICPICKKPLKGISKEQLPKGMAQGKPLFYRNPMHPEVTSPTLMKDEMGMDYIAVYETGELTASAAAQEGSAVSRVRLTKEQAGLAGVVVEPIGRLKLSKEIRTVGRIAYDPELTITQEEYLTAFETRQKVSQSPDPDVIARAQDLLDKSRFKLRLLGMGNDEIDQLEIDGVSQKSLVLPEDKAWVYADVYEYDLSWVKPGQTAQVTTTAYPGEVFEGIIKSVTPVLDPKTRTVRVRMEINNPDRKLKPEMYADVVIKSVYKDSQGQEEVLALPREALLDTGSRKVVYVDAGNGTFIGKEVTIGPESISTVKGVTQTFYPVLSGLTGSELVVTKGNFLVDSQSQLAGGMSVLWGGAQEIKAEGEPATSSSQEAAPVATEHKH